MNHRAILEMSQRDYSKNLELKTGDSRIIYLLAFHLKRLYFLCITKQLLCYGNK